MHIVAVLALDRVIAFDLAIPLEVFGRAQLPGGRAAYRMLVCAPADEIDAGAFILRPSCAGRGRHDRPAGPVRSRSIAPGGGAGGAAGGGGALIGLVPPAQDRHRAYRPLAIPGLLGGRLGERLAEALVQARPDEVRDVLAEHAGEVARAENEQVIQACAAHTPRKRSHTAVARGAR